LIGQSTAPGAQSRAHRVQFAACREPQPADRGRPGSRTRGLPGATWRREEKPWCVTNARRLLRGDRRELVFRQPANAGRSRLCLWGAESAGRVRRYIRQSVHRYRCGAPACGHRRGRPAAAAGARLAADLVRVAHGDAGAGRGLHGHRSGPARDRSLRQAPGRVRHRHPRRRPGRVDGRTRPRAFRAVRDRHGNADQLRPGRRSPRPRRVPGRLRGPPPRRVCLTAPVPPPAAQRTALAPRLQPAPCRRERVARQGTGGLLLRRGVRRLGRDEEAARRHRQVLHRPPRVGPRRAARHLRVLPRDQRHHRAERRAQDPAADPPRPGDGRSGEHG
jgi:hypothetical protein